MKKTIKRTIAFICLSGLVMISGLISLIIFPQSVFAHRMDYNNFSIYANSPINTKIKAVLENSNALVKNSELYDLSYTYDLFLSHNTFFNQIDDTFLGSQVAGRAVGNNVIIKAEVDIENNIAINHKNVLHKNKANLTRLITHEMVHCLQENKYGKLKFNPFNHPPMWKLEGYPEYIARQEERKFNEYSLKNEIRLFLKLEKESKDGWIKIDEDLFVPKVYYQGRLMVEYLIDIKKLSYDLILKENITEDKVYVSMINWCKEE